MADSTSSADSNLRDCTSGRLLSHMTHRQREFYLERNPHMAGKIPPMLHDPHEIPAWTASSYFNGMRVVSFEEARRERARQAGLLRDPAHSLFRKEPTQLRKVEYTAYRTAVHESSHTLIADALGVKLYKLTIKPEPEDNTLGRLLHEPSTPEKEIIILLAGREGELAVCGDAGEGDGSDVRHATKLARELNPNNPDEAMRIYRTAARNMVLERKRLISALAFELHRKQELLLDQIYDAIAIARKKIAAESQPTRQVQSSSASTSTSASRKGRTLTHAEMVQRFGPALVGTTAIMTGKRR